MDGIQFLSAFGLGAVVTALIQAWLSNRAYVAKRNFEEKKECYVGFLDAMHQSEIDQSEEAAKNVGRWNNRIELVGSQQVISACQKIRDTNPIAGNIHPDRPRVLLELKSSMRKDMGVAVD